MGNIVRNLAITSAIVIGLPVIGLMTYDFIAVRPHVAQIEAILSSADPQDASPSPSIRKLIDASAGSPDPYVTRLVTSRFYSNLSQGQWHTRNALWQILLPMHFSKTEMYGLFSSLAPNGVDIGLSNYARREFGKELDQLTLVETSRTVAITRSPSIFIRNPERHGQYAAALVEKSGLAP